jgi:hypothetical protein
VLHSRGVILAFALTALSGCAHRGAAPLRATTAPPQFYRTVGLTQPIPVESVLAQCVPPDRWRPEPLKESDRHTHQIWLSPTGKTAYGVIHFKLPLPVGPNFVHFEFLREMKKREGRAIELAQRGDPSLPGLRFVCEGELYKLRVNLICRGFEGWAIYAGTLRNEPERPEEVELAERARENTIIGLPSTRQTARRN